MVFTSRSRLGVCHEGSHLMHDTDNSICELKSYGMCMIVVCHCMRILGGE